MFLKLYSIFSSYICCFKNLDWVSSGVKSLRREASWDWVAGSNLNWGLAPDDFAIRYWK